MPKLSIIIPCYNPGNLLLECIEGFQNFQTDYSYEIIVVNDGSTDEKTLKVLDEVESDGIHVIHQENRGLGGARNTGIKASKGEFIMPLDQDNILLEDYLNYGIPEFERDEQVGVVYSDIIDFGEREGARKVPDFDYCRLFRSNYIDAGALIRRNYLEQMGGYDDQMPVLGYEDWDLWMRMTLKGIKFKHIDKYGYKYRVQKGSMLADTMKHRKELVEYIFAKPEFEQVRWIQDLIKENRALKASLESREYRIGKFLLKPARVMQRLLKDRWAWFRAIIPVVLVSFWYLNMGF